MPNADRGDRGLVRLASFSLRHRKAVALVWLLLTAAGVFASGRAFDAFSQDYSVPGREGYETNAAITRSFGAGGNEAPIVTVVELPPRASVQAPPVRAALRTIDARIADAVPGARSASYVSTGSRAFVSADGTTTFVLTYAPPEPGHFGQSPAAAKAVASAVRGVDLAGGSVHVTGFDALNASSGRQGGGLGVLAEGLLGGQRAAASAGRAVVFSGVTVAIGLLSLVVLPVPFLRGVGVGTMLIPLVSVGIALTLLPVLLASLGPRLDWPHVRSDDRASRFWTRWAQMVVRHRWIAAAAAVALLGALTFAATSLHLSTENGDPDTISQAGAAKAGLNRLETSGIGDGALTPIEILAPSGKAAALASRLSMVPGVHGAAAPTGASWRRDGEALVDVIPRGEGGGIVTAVRDAAHAAGADVRVGGIVAQSSDFISAVYGAFPLMIALIAVLAFLLLARAFRSLLLPLKAVLLNVLSVSAACGAVVLVWQKGYGSHLVGGVGASGAIPSWLPLMVFAFLFGLSMDYEVFILARMREEYDATGSTDAAVVNGIGRTGRLVTSASLILFLGFLAMSTAPSTQTKMIATGLGVGILFDATVIRALLVPAAVSLFGPWNWWLPHAPARLLRVEASPDPLLAEDD